MVIKGQMGLVLGWINCGELEEKERVTIGGKGRDEIRSYTEKTSRMLQICIPWTAWEKGMECLVDDTWKSGVIVSRYWA